MKRFFNPPLIILLFVICVVGLVFCGIAIISDMIETALGQFADKLIEITKENI